MTAQIIDGKTISKKIQAEIGKAAKEFFEQSGVKPKLAAVLVGDDPASQVYVRNKERACKRANIESELFRLPASSTTADVIDLVKRLNGDPQVNGILVQLPLPDGVDAVEVLDTILPEKDVDAFHPENVGLLSQGRPRFLPCTPFGIVHLLAQSEVETTGKNVCIVGRSDIVGKPMAMMLSQRSSQFGSQYANATVSLCHSRTKDLVAYTKMADILVAAIGKPNFIRAEHIKPGAVVIDVGINRTDDGLVGDVDFDAVSAVASRITPVPGGVGPMTVTILLDNTLKAARLQQAGPGQAG
jgi:methylenetetrahydrofolate dehydrogenase (NADP+)/methenyltetrahydrofolate cyclohydrolase